MEMYIETVEGTYSLQNLRLFTRDIGNGFGIKLVYQDDKEFIIFFESTRGRDAAHNEIAVSLGRSIFVNIAKFQDWVDKGY
jgi:hypothetical protein